MCGSNCSTWEQIDEKNRWRRVVKRDDGEETEVDLVGEWCHAWWNWGRGWGGFSRWEEGLGDDGCGRVAFVVSFVFSQLWSRAHAGPLPWLEKKKKNSMNKPSNDPRLDQSKGEVWHFSSSPLSELSTRFYVCYCGESVSSPSMEVDYMMSMRVIYSTSLMPRPIADCDWPTKICSDVRALRFLYTSKITP